MEANVHACISIFDDDLPRSTSAASFPRQTYRPGPQHRHTRKSMTSAAG